LLLVLYVINFCILGFSYQRLDSDRLIFIWLSFSTEFSFFPLVIFNDNSLFVNKMFPFTVSLIKHLYPSLRTAVICLYNWRSVVLRTTAYTRPAVGGLHTEPDTGKQRF